MRKRRDRVDLDAVAGIRQADDEQRVGWWVAGEVRPPDLPHALRELVERYFGVPVIVGEEFRGVDGIDQLYIFGSWADRFRGVEGPEPYDIDLLAVGKPDRDVAYESALRVERRIDKPVNVTIRSNEAWSRKEDGFLQHVASSSLIPIITTEERGNS